MNQEIVAVQQIEGDLWVDARELHGKLGSKQDFSNWVKSRLSTVRAVEGENFFGRESKSTGGRPTKEFSITLDTASEFALLEKNEEGREIRRYFATVKDKFFATPITPPALPNLSQMEILAQLIVGTVGIEKRLNGVVERMDAAEAKAVQASESSEGQTSVRGRPATGKRSNDEYKRVTVYLSKKTVREARRKLFEQEREELESSELLEEALRFWIERA